MAQNGTIGQVPAFDPDQNATLEFAIEKNPLVEVHPQNGILSLFNANWQRQIDTEQSICVSDGPNVICSKALIHLVTVSTQTLRKNAVTVFVEGIPLDELLSAATFLRFIQAFSSLWDWAMPENIRVFGVEEKRRHSNGTELAGTMVNLFVTRNSEMEEEKAATISSWLVEDAIEEFRANLSLLFGAPIHLKRESLCVSEPCPYFQRCRSALRFLRMQETLSTDDFVFRPISTLRSFSCECPRGFITNSSMPGECNQRLNQCFDGPCLHGGTCHPLEGGFRCSCVVGWTGLNCELATFGLSTCLPGYCFSSSQCQVQMPNLSPVCFGCPWRPIDSDERCRLRAVSFGGDSFLALPKTLSRLDWSLTLSFATISPSGTLIFSGTAEGDFLHLSLEGGIPQIQFSLGGNDFLVGKLAGVKPNFVNDGEWHSVKLEYSEWKMRLSVDHCDVHSSLLLGTLSPKCAVEVTVPLAQKCLLDFAVPCQRFLDLPKSILIGGFGQNAAKKFDSASSFVGVVKDLRLDGQLAHFSNWEQLERTGPNIWPGSARFRPDRCQLSPGEKSPCAEQTRCLDRWLGHHCRCHFRVHSPRLNCPFLLIGQEPPALTLADDSFAVWALPSEFLLPFSLHFEFRTRERKGQVITLDFEQSAQMLIFSLENGQSMVRVNSEQYLLPFPATLSDGNWHSVEANFSAETLEIGVDVLYKKSIPLMALSTPRSLHSGTVPSSAHPAAFFGCIRNVEWNGQRLRLANQSATRQSCLAPNVCQMSSTQCPANSKCVRDWDRHSCKCNSGFVGDSCIDACSLPNICGPFSHAICVHSPNSPKGYECLCPEGRTGPNCESGAIPSDCPEGWFGQFPRCQRCHCSSENGFATQCNRTNGQCICRDGTFLLSDNASDHRCVSCHCGYGTAPGALDRCDRQTGQCECIGDAVGRQCDRCEQKLEQKPLLLERRSLKCVQIDGRCPSQMEMGVQWPTTGVGSTARQSCPHSMMGIATRLCSENGIWSYVNDFNCTLPSLFALQNRIFEDAKNAQIYALSRQLVNVTRQNWPTLRGKNVQIVFNLLSDLLFKEMTNNWTELAGAETAESARSIHFARNLLRVADILLTVRQQKTDDGQQMNEQQFEQLAAKLAHYGAFMANLYQHFHFIQSFKYSGRNLVFAIDQLSADGSSSFSPSDTFLRHKKVNLFGDVHLRFEFANFPSNFSSSLRMFYSVANSNFQNVSPIFSFYATERIVGKLKMLNLALPIVQSFGHYECLAKFAGGHWQSVALVGLNRTHVQCQIVPDNGKLPLMVRAMSNQKASGITFFPFTTDNRILYSTPNNFISIICTVCTICAFVVLAASFSIGLYRDNYHCRLLLCSPIAAFSFNALFVQLIRRTQSLNNSSSEGDAQQPLLCAALFSVLAASLCALFAFLLLYSLHLCKLLLKNVDKNCQKRHFTFGLLLPLLIGGSEFLMLLQINTCHVPIGSVPFCLLTVPSAVLCLFNFYSLATSWFLSWHKQFQLAVLRFAFRRLHFSHSVLVFLCAVLFIFDFFLLFRPFPSQFVAIFSSFLLVFVAIYFFFWANFFTKTLKEHKNIQSSANSDKSAESMWLARDAEISQTPPQNQLICADSAGRANFYANSPFHRGVLPFPQAKRRPRLNDGKIYEGIADEWNSPVGAGEGGTLAEEPTFVHHTLQRMPVGVNVPHILSPSQRPPAPPSSMVDAIWSLEEEKEQQQRRHRHLLLGTLPIGGMAHFTHNSQIHQQNGLSHGPLHYGSVHAIDRKEMTPNTRRRRTQPIQMVPTAENGSLKNLTESHRNRKFGPENTLDDELNCAYFTFTRRREQTVVTHQRTQPMAPTTFN